MAVLSPFEQMLQTIGQRHLATPDTPVLLMVSGGSDSTALAYLCAELHASGHVGPVAVFHVNHQLRGADADADAAFVEALAEALHLPFYLCEIDVGGIAHASGENVEAVARRERYAAAQEALERHCRSASCPISEGRIFTAHTQNDRVENFYMRSIVGTGPGGFRSMRYRNGAVARPCLDLSRDDLRDYLRRRELDAAADAGVACVRDAQGQLWRTDATNAHTDKFRAFVRHRIVPVAKERNARLEEVLCRSMNLIADEDDMLDCMAAQLVRDCVVWQVGEGATLPDPLVPGCATGASCLLRPAFAKHPVPLKRRALRQVLQAMLDAEARVETASIQAVLDGFADCAPISGYTGNIQGNLALSANKRGLRIEPMEEYRARRKGVRTQPHAPVCDNGA